MKIVRMEAAESSTLAILNEPLQINDAAVLGCSSLPQAGWHGDTQNSLIFEGVSDSNPKPIYFFLRTSVPYLMQASGSAPFFFNF